MKFTRSTGQNHLGYVRAAVREAQQAEAALLRPDGFRRYSDEEHGERIFGIRSKRDAIIDNADEVGRTAVTALEARLATIDAGRQNPLSRLNPDELAVAANLRAFCEADVRRHNWSEIEAQVRAAAAGSNRGQQVAWHHALVGRRSELDRPLPVGEHLGTNEVAEIELLNGAIGLLAEKLDDPSVKEQRREIALELEDAQDFLNDLNAELRPLRVQAEQERLVATGNYGQRVAEPTTVRNIGAAPVPVYEMAEQN